MNADLFTDLAEGAQTVAVNLSSSGDNTISTHNEKFVVLDLHLETTGTAVDVTFKSGSTSISGAIPFKNEQVREMGISSEKPIFYARSAGDSFVINLSTNASVVGYVNILEAQ